MWPVPAHHRRRSVPTPGDPALLPAVMRIAIRKFREFFSFQPLLICFFYCSLISNADGLTTIKLIRYNDAEPAVASSPTAQGGVESQATPASPSHLAEESSKSASHHAQHVPMDSSDSHEQNAQYMPTDLRK